MASYQEVQSDFDQYGVAPSIKPLIWHRPAPQLGLVLKYYPYFRWKHLALWGIQPIKTPWISPYDTWCWHDIQPVNKTAWGVAVTETLYFWRVEADTDRLPIDESVLSNGKNINKLKPRGSCQHTRQTDLSATWQHLWFGSTRRLNEERDKQIL